MGIGYRHSEMHGVAIPNDKVATNKFLAKVRLKSLLKIFKPTFKKKMNSTKCPRVKLRMRYPLYSHNTYCCNLAFNTDHSSPP